MDSVQASAMVDGREEAAACLVPRQALSRPAGCRVELGPPADTGAATSINVST